MLIRLTHLYHHLTLISIAAHWNNYFHTCSRCDELVLSQEQEMLVFMCLDPLLRPWPNVHTEHYSIIIPNILTLTRYFQHTYLFSVTVQVGWSLWCEMVTVIPLVGKTGGILSQRWMFCSSYPQFVFFLLFDILFIWQTLMNVVIST